MASVPDTIKHGFGVYIVLLYHLQFYIATWITCVIICLVVFAMYFLLFFVLYLGCTFLHLLTAKVKSMFLLVSIVIQFDGTEFTFSYFLTPWWSNWWDWIYKFLLPNSFILGVRNLDWLITWLQKKLVFLARVHLSGGPSVIWMCFAEFQEVVSNFS